MEFLTRTECDFFGEKEINNFCYYGIQTLRAVENFNITRTPISAYPELIRALAAVKKAACQTNYELGMLPKDIAQAVMEACDDLLNNCLHDQFIVDVLQGGVGTSTNMNANEVIANRALEIMGHEKGSYEIVHPNYHVNCSQSTSDVYSTALRISVQMTLLHLINRLESLKKIFMRKGEAIANILKTGRNHRQDTVPMTLGMAFTSYAVTIFEDIQRLEEAYALLHKIKLLETAMGAGHNTPKGYAALFAKKLREVNVLPVVLSISLVETTWDTGAYIQVSGALKHAAIKLSKICSDLRLLCSGPIAGLNETNLPKIQPRLPIIPGKVNPVILEVVNQVAYKVAGNDVAITMAYENGQLELNAMEPLVTFNLLESAGMLSRAVKTLGQRCVMDIPANASHCKRQAGNSSGVAVALVTGSHRTISDTAKILPDCPHI
jgi:aspartate ammonia-lyase